MILLRFRSTLTAMLAVAMAACASTPPGPSDAEVEAELQTNVQLMSQQVVAGATDQMLESFAEDARMSLQNVNGVSTEVTGHAAIRSVVSQAGAPPALSMTVQTFARTGDTATQDGIWDISGLTGTFSIVWRRADGAWKITGFDFIG